MKFVNIHTHLPAHDGSIELINHFAQAAFDENSPLVYSVGLHPWHIAGVDYLSVLEKTEETAKSENVAAIGECGLDRAITVPFDLQESIFIRQIEMAEKLRKPLIIHAVKVYPNLIRIKKNRKSNIPWILHGYNGNLQSTRQLLQHNFCFSFGPQILKGNEKLLRSLLEIPLEQLFFETDDSGETIETIYIFAAQKLGIPVEKLRSAIDKNYKQIFKNG